MKLGAVTVLDRGCAEQELWDGIAAGLRKSRADISRKRTFVEVRDRFDQWDDRQKEVLYLVSHGYTNKEVAKELRLPKRAVEECRRRIMEKLNVDNFAALMRLVIALERDADD